MVVAKDIKRFVVPAVVRLFAAAVEIKVLFVTILLLRNSVADSGAFVVADVLEILDVTAVVKSVFTEAGKILVVGVVVKILVIGLVVKMLVVAVVVKFFVGSSMLKILTAAVFDGATLPAEVLEMV